MNTNTVIYNDWENSTAQIVYSSNTSLTAGAIAGVFMAVLVITLLLCKYKSDYFVCFRLSMRNRRRPSNVGLTNTDEEETENITSDIQVEDDYFYDEVFERSAFTDETTNNSITNLFTITELNDDDDDDNAHAQKIHNHESHI